MKNKAIITLIILAVFMALENLCLYYFFKQGFLTSGKNAILLFSSSIAFGLVLLYRFYNADISIDAVLPGRKKLAYVLTPLFIVGLVLLGMQHSDFLAGHTIEGAGSDIVPSIQNMVKRFLLGRSPYEYVNGQHTGYFPFHWLPFIFAEKFNTEYRMVPYIVWAIAALWLCVRSVKTQNIVLQILIPFIILGSDYVMFCNNTTIIEATVELMIAGYYMMLMIGLNTKNAILQGIVFSLCLLSRYSLIIWMPLFAFTLFVSGHRKQLYISAAVATALVLLIFIIPYASKDWSLLVGFKGYDSAAVYEWEHVYHGYPLHLWSGTGFAYYFYTRFTELDIYSRIKLLQKAHLICCCGVTVIMGVWYWFKKDRIDYRLFLLGSFKIYISIFLFLIQVPYVYLTCVGNFITIAIFCEQARYQIKYRAVANAAAANS